MKFGIAYANVAGFSTAEGASTLGRAAEAAGFESLWTVEHLIWPENYESTYPYDPSGKMPVTRDNPFPDPLIWLGFVAATTTTIRLGTGISLLPEREPITYAKEVATLDTLSGSRVELGIGIGWLKEEFAALGVPWERRGARTEEYMEVMRTLWAGDDVSFAGEFVDFAHITSNPKPPGGAVPIHIGGHSEAAARRAGRVGDGFMPAKGDMRELFDICRQTAADSGRDPAAIELTGVHLGLFGEDPGAAVEEAREWGMDRIMVPSFFFFGDTEDSIAAYGENVVARFSD